MATTAKRKAPLEPDNELLDLERAIFERLEITGPAPAEPEMP